MGLAPLTPLLTSGFYPEGDSGLLLFALDRRDRHTAQPDLGISAGPAEAALPDHLTAQPALSQGCLGRQLMLALAGTVGWGCSGAWKIPSHPLRKPGVIGHLAGQRSWGWF